MARALKPGAPLAFTYHHNKLEAYHSIGVAILDAGLTCSASLPCPAEMGGSIHIFGTGSSIVDTVFVCRANGETSHKQLFSSPPELIRIVRDDLSELKIAGVKPTIGDIRCIVFGHLTRMAIWQLRRTWDASASTAAKTRELCKRPWCPGALPRRDRRAFIACGNEVPPSVQKLPLFRKEERDAVAF